MGGVLHLVCIREQFCVCCVCVHALMRLHSVHVCARQYVCIMEDNIPSNSDKYSWLADIKGSWLFGGYIGLCRGNILHRALL